MRVVLVMFKDSERREFPLPDDRTVLGRKQECELRIPTRDVSREHCEITVQGQELHARDLGSSNGTFVNGKRIAESKLNPGDQLRIGPVTFIVQIDGKPADIQPPTGAPPTEVTPSSGPSDDEETFELSEEDFDLDDPMSALEMEEDEDDLP